MTIELLTKSDFITARDAKPFVPQAFADEGASLRYAEADVTLTGTGSTSTSTYLAIRLPSNAVLKWGSVYVTGDTATDAPNMDVGVREVGGNNTLDDDALAAALDVDDTGPHDFIGALGSQDTTKQMWEWAGESADPGGDFDIHLSLDADIVTAGDVKVCVYYTLQ